MVLPAGSPPVLSGNVADKGGSGRGVKGSSGNGARFFEVVAGGGMPLRNSVRPYAELAGSPKPTTTPTAQTDATNNVDQFLA